MKNNSQNAQRLAQIMEIKVNSSSVSSVLTRVEDFISHNSKFYIVTPNPELVLASQTDSKLKKALNAADLSIPDGFGLKLAIPSLTIIKGRELFLDLVKLAGKNNWKVFLLGGLGDEAKLATDKLKNSLKNENCKLKIEFEPGPKLDNNARPLTKEDTEIEKRVIEKINKFAPQLLFVAFGNPKQEIWINEHLSELNIGGAMAVGGTFRYIAGTSTLPPKWMDSCGLEWLWRFVTEPKRFGRVFKAVFVFPLSLLLFKCSRVKN